MANTKETKLLEYFRLSGVSSGLHEFYSMIMDSLSGQLSEMFPETLKEKMKSVLVDDLLPAQLEDVMQTCDDIMTEADLDALIAHYNSDLGKRMREIEEKLKESMTALQPKYMALVQEKVQQIMEGEFEDWKPEGE